MPAENNPSEKAKDSTNSSHMNKRKIGLFVAGLLLLILVIVVGLRGYQFASTPDAIRQPTVDHYHFRTQIFYDGQPINFADQKYQETYDGGQCSANLPDTPIHFHDNTDQMTHIHWNGMTGGLFLKYYGLNLVGGPDDKLGYRFDKSYLKPQPVSIQTDSLANVPYGHDIFVFIKTDDGFKEKSIFEFLEQDLEVFFEKRSNLGSSSGNWYDWFLPKAQAHASEDHGSEVTTEFIPEKVDLQKLNNLIGDVAIYVQQDRPSDEEVTNAFNNLIELSETTCGG